MLNMLELDFILLLESRGKLSGLEVVLHGIFELFLDGLRVRGDGSQGDEGHA